MHSNVRNYVYIKSKRHLIAFTYKILIWINIEKNCDHVLKVSFAEKVVVVDIALRSNYDCILLIMI